jgi:cell division protein FtsW (lipid II flippase)
LGKYIKGLSLWFLTPIAAVIIKPFYDVMIEPVTGEMVVMGLPDYFIALVGAVPWVFPIIAFFVGLYIMIKPSEDKDRLRRPPSV